MAKSYSKASDDVMKRIERLRKKHYEQELHGVQIGALFVYTDKAEQCLTHQGYPAAAVARVVNTRDRAAGMPDALIVIDRFYYSSLTGTECDALIDHELHHYERPRDKKTGRYKVDPLDRPKLEIRKHDRSFGWFDEIAARYGNASIEVKQAKALLDEARQLYFDFAAAA